MATTAPQEVDFHIVSQAFDSWNVQFRIDVSELLDQQGLLHHLRLIKQKIAKLQSLPEASMLFDGIIRKTRSEDFVDVVVRIKKVLYEKGNPRVYFKDGIGADGTVYSSMTAFLDIFYLDQFEKPIMLDRVMQAIFEAAISVDSLDKGIVNRKLQETLENQSTAKNIPIAKGVFPDIGKDAEIDFFFQAIAEPGKTDHYYSSRRVNRGDLLCHKIPATVGASPGINVKGEQTSPRAGLDIELRSGSGSELSLDENEAVAVIDGVVVVDRSMKRVKMISGTKEIPQFILIKVNPVLRVEGNRVVDISSSQTVEIVGSLSMGSRILTDCEVYVSGDVEEGTLIQAADTVTVEGKITGSTIQSETDIIAQSDVVGSVLHSKDQIVVKGTVRNSSLTADTAHVETIKGSSIVTRNTVTIGRIDADENNILSTICVGMFDFFRQRIKENELFIERAKENLSRIELLAGPEIMKHINSGNVQTMLMRFLASHRMSVDSHSRQQVEIYRQLLESVPPTKTLLVQKEIENLELLKKIANKEAQEDNVIVVREKMTARALFAVNGVEAEVNPTNSPTEVRSDGQDNLIIAVPRKNGGSGSPHNADQAKDRSE